MEQNRVQKLTFMNIISCSLTKEERHYNGAKITSSESSAGTTGPPHAKNINLETDLTTFIEVTQNES